MARDATARLYDVDEDSLSYSRAIEKEKYDTGTIVFHAKKGKLVDLDKLHESIWATRLSGGTNSGVLSLEVTAVGRATFTGTEALLSVTGSKERFLLVENVESKESPKRVLEQLRDAAAREETRLSVTGLVKGWRGKWPVVLRRGQPKPRQIMVTGFQTAQD